MIASLFEVRRLGTERRQPWCFSLYLYPLL